MIHWVEEMMINYCYLLFEYKKRKKKFFFLNIFNSCNVSVPYYSSRDTKCLVVIKIFLKFSFYWNHN